MKCAKLLLNIVDFAFDDTCWLARLIEYVIMGGLLMPIIYMWWNLSLLIPWVMVSYFLVLIKLQFFHVATSFCATTSCLCSIIQVFSPSYHCCASFYVAITCLCAIFCFCIVIVFCFHIVHVVVFCLCILLHIIV